MKREEAEKLAAELILQARICQLTPDNFPKLEAARKAVEDALCVDHSSEASKMVEGGASFEFYGAADLANGNWAVFGGTHTPSWGEKLYRAVEVKP